MSLFDFESSPGLLTSLFFFALLFKILVRKLRHTSLPYPPGPKPKLFIGNSGDLPTTKPWIVYADWARKYGHMVHVKDYSQHVVIISSLKDAVELFEKRSDTYSDRPNNTMLPLMGWEFNMGLMRYGNLWRQHRRLSQQSFRRDASISYRPIQARKIHEMLRNLLATPEEFTMHYKTVAAAIIMATAYGYDISPTNDYFVSLSEQAVRKLSDAVFPGAAVVNAIPVLRHIPSWFPGAGFKRFGEECKVLTYNMKNVPYNYVRKNMAQGMATPAILMKLLERHDARGDSEEVEEIIKGVIATSYAAGADTTASATGTFFYAMACNPQVQKRAQEEIDRVIGSHRLPNYDDRSALPYVEALYREVLRWRPVLPLGVPHATSKDDIYKGYFIPKGTTVIPNVWVMTHDETVYTTPELFLPERYFDSYGNLNDDDVMFTFGFGRRICVGRHMASASLWFIIASILSTFNITKAKDASGKEIPLSVDYSDGLISHPLPYQCSVTPRSEQAVKLITETQED